MKKYIGAVVRKSFQREIITEIGPFENFGPLQKKIQYINEKAPFKKKIKTILRLYNLALHSIRLKNKFILLFYVNSLMHYLSHLKNVSKHMLDLHQIFLQIVYSCGVNGNKPA